jgi:alkylated DNA nucleotide flippase Atl1
MLKTRTSWREKLGKELPDHGKVVDVPPKMQKRFGTGKMIIPRPLDVDALIRKVEKGKLVTVPQIREKLAKDAHVDSACPLTIEDLRRGKKDITPFWRVLKADGSLNEKFPGGTEAQAARLREEGHTIEPGEGRKPPRVKEL